MQNFPPKEDPLQRRAGLPTLPTLPTVRQAAGRLLWRKNSKCKMIIAQ